MAEKLVYYFGPDGAEGSAEMRDLLGGKGANLAEMSRLKLPVPAGFTISTRVCAYYSEKGEYPEHLKEQVEEALRKVEKAMGKKFGDPSNPLLVSVRSGAPISMPGMMDTVLNLGINDQIAEALAESTENPRFAYDTYRRFIQMYGDVVMGLKPESSEEVDPFENLLSQLKKERGAEYDTDLTAEDLKELVARYKALIKERLGRELPSNPQDQLWEAIGAVFRSWNNERAIAYRKLEGIPDDLGTAVNVQAMVYGNIDDTCGTGVVFTRDSALGTPNIHGEYLINAQGEDVVAGIRTPMPISKDQDPSRADQSLEVTRPETYKQLVELCRTLERHYRDMQDIEFTVQNNKLWLLQTRTGKRSGIAAVRIAVDMVKEGIIDEKTALLRIDPEKHLNQLLQPIFDPKELKLAQQEKRQIASGLPAGPGAASGRIVFTAEDAVEWAKRGEDVLLVRHETSPEDIKGMAVSKGFLTARGGATSHASLVARQMGKVCIAGSQDIDIDYQKKVLRAGGMELKEGEWLSLDGFEGKVYRGKIATRPSEVIRVLIKKELSPEEAPLYQLFAKVMEWANKYRKLEVWANADQPDQASNAVAFGAQGIGLCRTEHMFFEGDRILSMQKMILAATPEERKAALSELLPLQEKDFYEIFEVMNGRPVTIRLLDPPLHEFLPKEEKQKEKLAQLMGKSVRDIERLSEDLAEANPMLGHRGCRLAITYPEIAEMQVTAIIRAACRALKNGIPVKPEIMIPIVSLDWELKTLRELTKKVADEIIAEFGVKLDYSIGTMIELPRACLVADQIAKYADFFSFGTNDLTQTTFGYSRDDAAPFLSLYLEKGWFQRDPFQTIDRDGVGQLMKLGIDKGRSSNPELKLGICGEHGGDPDSVKFCHQLELNYVSCSPFRIPVAILSAAQAALEGEK